MSDAVAVQPYYKIERMCQTDGQVAVTIQHAMSLHPDYIQTHAQSFSIRDVYDMSYRRLGDNKGILYLHTNQGVFPYNVNSDPNSFIAAFRKQIQRY